MRRFRRRVADRAVLHPRVRSAPGPERRLIRDATFHVERAVRGAQSFAYNALRRGDHCPASVAHSKMHFPERFDVIVIGGGHAGTEAALASARMGRKTLLLTHNIETLGQMSCNPSIGGIGKGHLVKEVDALGGAMAIATDEAGIQFRMLNSSKGPAVRATRAQADRILYKAAIRRRLETEPNLTLFQQAVDDLLIRGDRVIGAVTQIGVVFEADAVVLTTGTFLSGLVHVGLQHYEAGRAGDPPAKRLGARLRELALPVGRLKTGTPPRLDGRTIDFGALAAQPGDDPAPVFSFMGDRSMHPRQVPCWITHTNGRTHEIIRGGLDRSPLFTGVIQGVGPRYCPSIEDKVVRFPERDAHQIYLEPEGLDTTEIYPNGISTSLPFDVQLALVRSMKGCERAHLLRPGYSIEYDFFDPRALKATLETKAIAGLFFAGQINGTTGYEEAAAQGLLAGDQCRAARPWRGGMVAAARRGLPRRAGGRPDHAGRDRALPDVHLARRVSPAAPRGQCRPAADRARPAARPGRRPTLGRVLPQARRRRARARTPQVDLRESVDRVAQRKQNAFWDKPWNESMRSLTCCVVPGVRYAELMTLPGAGEPVADAAVAEQVEIATKYEGYIERQKDEIARHLAHEETRLPPDLDYRAVRGLTAEVQQKLAHHRPETVGQAARISGVTPAAISLLLVHLKRMAAEPAAPDALRA